MNPFLFPLDFYYRFKYTGEGFACHSFGNSKSTDIPSTMEQTYLLNGGRKRER